MARSFKYKDDNYLDSSGGVFDKEPLDKILAYSTEEQMIGKWVDGKNVYKRVIKSTVANIANDINSIGIDTFIDVKGKAQSVYNNTWDIPNTFIEDTGYNIVYHIVTSSKQFNISFGNYFSNNGVVIMILEYTKTTD